LYLRVAGIAGVSSAASRNLVVAMNILEGDAANNAIQKLVTKHKLDSLRIANGEQWQKKFQLPEQIPVTLVVHDGTVRVIHDSFMPDPVSFLEADVKSILATGSRREVAQH
jgi:hypothetical protein